MRNPQAPMLDCLTPAGRFYLDAERALLDRYLQVYPDLDCAITPPDSPARVDALISQAGRLVSIVEVKARPSLTMAGLRQFGSCLCAEDKILAGKQLAELLRVPFLLLVGLADAIAVWTVVQDDGAYAFRFPVHETVTQASINGGTALRRNAFLPLDEMVVLPGGGVDVDRWRVQ